MAERTKNNPGEIEIRKRIIKTMKNTELEFLKDEVRYGFYIPTAVKQAWLAELKVLKEIDRICTENNIKYFADWGTLLGAVRHHGFVPWDDDMDICMTRDNYERFMSVADEELPEDFRIQNYERQENHWFFITRIVSSEHICFKEDYLRKYHNFPYIAGVDIFLIDYLYEDAEEEKARDDEVKEILAVAGKFTDNLEMSEKTMLLEFEKFKEKYGVTIPYGNGISERETAIALYKLAEHEMARVKSSETKKVGQIFPWVLKSGLNASRPKSWYENPVRLPFEFTTIPVENDYIASVTNRYGNYKEIHKVWGGHVYPFFESQKKNLEKVMGEELPSFMFERSMTEYRKNISCDEDLEAANHKKQILFITTGGTEDVNFEKTYEHYSGMEDADVYALTVPQLFKDPYGEIITDSAAYVNNASAAYADNASETYVDAAVEARSGAENSENKNAAAEAGLTDEDYEMLNFSFEGFYFDIIFIEDPYDDENPALSVPRQFYSKHLIPYCRKLIFIEPFEIGDFTEEDKNDCLNMKYYVSMPGLVYADEIWVSSENTKENFARQLTEWAGEDTKEYWKYKIKLISNVI